MRNWLVGLLIVGLVSILGCQAQDRSTGQTQRAPRELKVAVAAPFTGNAAAFGEMIRRGAELQAKEINDAGGINGMKFTLVFEDDAGKDAEASLVAERIANNLQILAVVGHFNSSCSLAGKPIYQRAGIVELSPGSTNVTVCEGSDWTFRNLYRDDFQGKFIAQYIDKVLTDLQSVAVFFDNDDYGRGLRNAFVDEAEKIGLDLVASEAYDRDNTDFKAQLTSIKAKNPDAVFISGLYTEAGLIAKQAREAGIEAQFFGADGVDSPDFLTIAGDAAEGTYLTTPFTFGAAGEDALQMAANFEEMHGVAPDTWAALTYDAVGMIAEALEKTYNAEAAVADNRKAIRDHLASLDTPEEGYKGVTGLTYFDINGDTVNKPAYVKIVKDGQFVAADQQLLELE
ncbi:ABC transporter substrate-binding protein [Candidatus Poribacteria bacterium]|nr:ABC transporter substrate-binding protein [Candidatus Poribacteria bacterium]MXY27318.1 ABC transporter substrate-binding protein [Candidatus Poribacteria bacterium]MYK18639.1 ABC transporter substrate-binding protein [Candidatus Poribacteria bacterium]